MHFYKKFSSTIVRNNLLLLLFALFVGCSHVDDDMIRGRRAINATLDTVEREMDDNPVYADSLVNLIDSRSIRNKEQRARYALLYTAAEYKNYQPLTSDSLIMEAVRHYSISSNLDYRFLSYYYLGCAYLDMEQMPDASVAFAQAEQLVNEIDNDYWKGLLYSRLGFYFYESCFFNRSEEYYLMSISCFDRAGKIKHKIYAMSEYANSKMGNLNFKEADSILNLTGEMALAMGDSSLYKSNIYNRLYCMANLNEADSATYLVNKYSLGFEEQLPIGHLRLMTLYYSLIGDSDKTEYCLSKAWNSDLSNSDSIYLYYISAVYAERQGKMEESLDLFRKYNNMEKESLRKLLNHPVTEAQESFFRTLAELETIKARNRATILVASIIISLLVCSFILIISINRRRKAQEEIRDYISTIDELAERELENRDKIFTLNSQVREMLRQQFYPSDYLYTRFYEQIDDNRKADHVYRVVKNQIDQFTGPKSIARIDELLNTTFDGIMERVLSSGLELKEKELLLLRFVLAGFSAKSIAAILGDTHINIMQRKKRLLDKIQFLSPEVMKELRNALNFR